MATANRAPKRPKSVVSPLSGANLPIGAHAKNTGGKKGRSGRAPQSFADFIAELRNSVSFQSTVRRIAESEESRNWGHVAKLVAQYDPDLPERKLKLEGQLTVTGVIALPVVQAMRPPEGEVFGVEKGLGAAPLAPRSLDALKALVP